MKSWPMKLLLTLICLVTLPLASCGNDDNQACLDTAAEIFKAAQRCGMQDSQASIENSFECDKVVRVRDEEELRTQCFPALETLDCQDLLTGNLPASCRSQLLKN